MGAICLAGALLSPMANAADEDSLEAALQAQMAPMVADGFSGAVLVADADGLVFERYYGRIDPDKAASIDADTRFNLASSGKLFTTVAILQLVESGKLDLDVPVGRYLPDWPNATVREQVTARQLLMHTSGLGQFWGAEFEAVRGRLQTLSDYQPLLTADPDFTPGSQWSYSNNGYMLLGLLIEAISGEDYYHYIQAHVFDPAGMSGAGYFEIDGQAPDVAVPYRASADGVERLTMPEPRGGPAGGGYARPRDLLAFHRALTGGKLLKSATLDLLFAPVKLPDSAKAPPHGLGMLRFAAGEDVGYGHPGGAPGIGVNFRGALRGGWMILLISNRDRAPLMPLGHAIATAIAEHGGVDLRTPMPPRRPQPR
ncbi:MAG: serine hydrolase domain-containing protein [Lysobacterales bacterium]